MPSFYGVDDHTGRDSYPFEVCEHALAHRLSDAVAAAYLRSDFFAKRISLMADWEKFCTSEVTP